MTAVPILEVAGFEFRFAARTPMRLPGYTGSAWRGGFGRALRRAVCITDLPVCAGCPLVARCIYPYVFETPGGPYAGILADYDRVPNPFVLAPMWEDIGTLGAGREVSVRLMLVGRATEHAAIARQAVIEAALHGLGPDRGILDLVAVERISPPPPQPCPELATIQLLSPLRLVEKGRLIGPETFRPRHVLLALLRRVSLLTQLHGPVAPELDFRALKACAEQADVVGADLRWEDWRRWSSRQQRLLPMGGLLGSLVLPMRGLEAFWPFLWLGPWVHAGKGATMGLGGMRVAAA